MLRLKLTLAFLKIAIIAQYCFCVYVLQQKEEALSISLEKLKMKRKVEGLDYASSSIIAVYQTKNTQIHFFNIGNYKYIIENFTFLSKFEQDYQFYKAKVAEVLF